MIDKKLQAYYENRFAMMATDGWTELLEDVEGFRTTINNVSPIQNEQDLFFRKGQLDILQWLLSLKQASEETYEQLMSGDSSNDS